MYCECGCGQLTRVPTKNLTSRGWIKGKPLRFISGHNSKGETGKQNKSWRGGRFMDGKGYIWIYAPDHPHADMKGYVMEHLMVTSAALGKPLPTGAIVHHHNENRQDNSNGNLVICPGRGYHMLLHARMRAYRTCGNALYRPCFICKKYDDPVNLPQKRHAACWRQRHKERYAKARKSQIGIGAMKKQPTHGPLF